MTAFDWISLWRTTRSDIRARRAQQHQQLADEVYDLIREAGGRLPPRPRRAEQADQRREHQPRG